MRIFAQIYALLTGPAGGLRFQGSDCDAGLVSADQGFDLAFVRRKTMRMSTFNWRMAGAVCALAGTLCSTVASGQIPSAKLLGDDGAAGDIFGFSVAVFGDVSFVGAPFDADNGSASGSVYVYHRIAGGWVQEQKLLADDGSAGDNFGTSVAVFGDMAIVGAIGDGDNGNSSGSAYVYRWTGSSWVQWQKLLPSDGTAGDQFGYSVSVNGDMAVVGAPYDTNGNGSNSGSAYVYRWNGSVWEQEQKLLASNGLANDNFGWSVSVSGDVAVVGAYGDGSGTAYVYRFNGSAWVEEQGLVSSGSAGDLFSLSVSVSADVVLVGALNDEINGPGSGSAYVFRFNGSAWVEEQKLLSCGGEAFDHFGVSVSVSGDVAVVGASLQYTNAGAADVFRFDGSTWVQERKLRPCDSGMGDQFGASVSVSGNVVVVGALYDNDNGSGSGSAYVFEFPVTRTADLDGDGDVDLLDFGMFQTQFTGPN
jgi:hypothetical protein